MNSDIIVISSACFTSVNRKIYQYFKKMNHDIKLVIPNKMKFSNNYKDHDLPEPNDPELIVLDLIGSNSRIYFYKGLINKLNILKPRTIIIDNEVSSLLSIILGIWCHFNKCRIFCICYENITLSLTQSLKINKLSKLPNIFLKNLLLFISSLFIENLFTINNESCKLYSEYGFKNVYKIPLGFDNNLFNINDDDREKIRLDLGINDEVVIAYFGRVCYEKGVHILINALSMLNHDKWVLLIDEFKDYETEYINIILNELRINGLEKNVIFINPTHKLIPKYMNASDIIVLPSISTNYWVEQYGRVIPEALACGKVVIGSKTGAIPMLIDNFGFIFPESDSLELSKILANVLLNMQYYSSIEYKTKVSNYAKDNLSIINQYNLMSTII
jgi:glycosyltransferase involved in cell wall biosynthesis